MGALTNRFLVLFQRFVNGGFLQRVSPSIFLKEGTLEITFVIFMCAVLPFGK